MGIVENSEISGLGGFIGSERASRRTFSQAKYDFLVVSREILLNADWQDRQTVALAMDILMTASTATVKELEAVFGKSRTTLARWRTRELTPKNGDYSAVLTQAVRFLDKKISSHSKALML